MPKISELPAAPSVGASDVIPIEQGGVTKGAAFELFADRTVPRIASTGETVAVAGIGHCYSTTGNMTIPAGTFADGNTLSIYNRTSGTLTVTQGSGLTLRLSGTASTGNRTLAQRTLATVWFESASEAVIIGAGVT